MKSVMIAALILSVAFSAAYAGRLKGYNIGKTQPDIDYRFDEKGLAKLDEAGFALYPTYSEEIYDLYYTYAKSSSTPMFVSADLPYHTLHLLVDYTVRIMEIEELLPRLEELTAGMLKEAGQDYGKSKGELKHAARAEFIYFAVAARLLGQEVELAGEDAKLVEKELSRIEEHKGLGEVSFLPEVKEDYSQYVPRGHYTRSDDFRRYFKAMMWYGRLPLHIPNDGDSLLAMQTALLISLNLEDNPDLNKLWEAIYEPTAFFFGYAEDLTPAQLAEETHEFYTEKLDPELFSDKTRLREFAGHLRKKYKPKILSEFALSSGDEEIDVPLSLRFMPQRFIPDSYIFSQLVFDRVTVYEGDRKPKPFTWGMTLVGETRVFPRGLDVMAVLGWENALNILADEGDTEFAGYDDQFQKMVSWYALLSDEERESSIYYRWFELFRAYRKASPPRKVDARAWEQKKLMTALGSWTELRHDAILYAKQSYTAMGTAAPPPPLLQAVVEEAPELYAQMAECARSIAEFAEPGEDIASTYLDFAEILDRLAELAKKQANGKRLTPEEHRWLWGVAAGLGYLPYRLGDVVTSEADERMALIADVHTDLNSGQVLEEATGNPAHIYVLVEIGGKPYVAQGATFTYYEFKHPISDRLTDEAWQKMLAEGKAPVMPGWTDKLFTH